MFASNHFQIRAQRLLNTPLFERCRGLAILIDESSTTELQLVFPLLIESLFGIVDNVGWGLHSITMKKNPQEYEVLCHFLGPMGPIFSLCYKLLPDCYLKYNFPVSYLPVCLEIKFMLYINISLCIRYYKRINVFYFSQKYASCWRKQ